MYPNSIESAEAAAKETVDAFPQKIALVCDWFLPRLGGIELHLRDLARHLMASGRTVEVITPFPGPGEVDGIRVHRLRVSRVPRLGFAWSPNLASVLRARLVEGGYDLVHAHFSIISPTAFWGAREAVRLQLPVVVTFHSILRHFKWTMSGVDSWLGWSHWPVALSAVSARVAHDVESIAGRGTVALLPNSTDTQFWKVARTKSETKTIRLISVQRLHAKKRPQALLWLLDRLKKSGGVLSDVRLDLVGDGPERESLEKLAQRLYLTDYVRFHGRLERAAVRELFSEAHAFVSLTRLEAFGLACLEARCAGLPVFALGNNGLEDWGGAMPGVVLAKTDDALFDGLAGWIRDAKRNAASSLPEVDARLDWQRGIQSHLALYRQARQRVSPSLEAGA